MPEALACPRREQALAVSFAAALSARTRAKDDSRVAVTAHGISQRSDPDRAGSGDSFVAGLVHGILTGRSHEKSLRLGRASAGAGVCSRGAPRLPGQVPVRDEPGNRSRRGTVLRDPSVQVHRVRGLLPLGRDRHQVVVSEGAVVGCLPAVKRIVRSASGNSISTSEPFSSPLQTR